MKTTIKFQIGNVATARQIARDCKCLLVNVREWGDYTWAEVMHMTEYELEDFEDKFDEATGFVVVRQEDVFYKMKCLR